MYGRGHHPKYRSKITIFSALAVIVIAILRVLGVPSTDEMSADIGGYG